MVMAPAKPNRAQRRSAGRGGKPPAQSRHTADRYGHHRRCPMHPARYKLLAVADRDLYRCTCWWDRKVAP